MKINPDEFEIKDPRNPEYSLREIDITANGMDPDKQWGKYRLSLRKNLKTGKFEIYRHYYIYKTNQVDFTGTIQECVNWINKHFGYGDFVIEGDKK